ncbi:NAD(P)-binding domain-containing protein [Spirosoma koreense]
MKPTLAILGMSPAGSDLAIRLTSQPYRLLLFDQDIQRAQALAAQLSGTNPLADLEAIDCQVNASWEADIIVLAVSEPARKQLIDRIREVATCKIVVSLTWASVGPTAADSGFISTIVSEELQQCLPNSKVVTVVSASQSAADEKPADALLIGADAGALTTVSALVQAAGWAPVIIEDWSATNQTAD